jgi:hypothetical protein
MTAQKLFPFFFEGSGIGNSETVCPNFILNCGENLPNPGAVLAGLMMDV